ncbi:MAG TPA: hypothetical protein VLB51_02690 [Methylomirabilota bacterium]|nr:hypothetical protein [Methylomirabilota bacterium]
MAESERRRRDVRSGRLRLGLHEQPQGIVPPAGPPEGEGQVPDRDRCSARQLARRLEVGHCFVEGVELGVGQTDHQVSEEMTRIERDHVAALVEHSLQVVAQVRDGAGPPADEQRQRVALEHCCDLGRGFGDATVGQ